MTFDCAYLLHRVYRNVENIEFVEIYRKGTKFIIEIGKNVMILRLYSKNEHLFTCPIKTNSFIIQHPVAFCYHMLFIKQTLISKTRALDFLVLLFYEDKCEKTLVKLKKFCSKYFLTINHQRYIIKVGVSLPT